MIGVAALVYAMIHFGLYAADHAFDIGKVASAATSTDGMIRRLGGRRWRRLHQLVYAIGVLAVIHYSFQSKLDLWEPTLMVGLLVWLLAYWLRSLGAAVRRPLPIPWVRGLSFASALVTALGEEANFRLAFGADPIRVLQADLSLATAERRLSLA